MATSKKIIIFAQGGTHGDFLYSCCQLVSSEDRKTTVDKRGRIHLENSKFKKNNLNYYQKGKKLAIDTASGDGIEMCHIWYEEFKKLPADYYYIHYEDEQIELIKKMFLEKVFDGNKDLAINDVKKYLPDTLANKITKYNIDDILTMFYKNSIKKYKQQPNIKCIKITDLYNFDSLVAILKNMNIYQTAKSNDLKKFHAEWKDKNKEYIEQILNVQIINNHI